jgi:putative ABC transport system permease protein
MSGGRVREAWGTVSSAPWRRAPLLLRRRPGVLATVAGATAVVAASVAAVPLFVSSVGTAAVAVQVAERCPRDTGVTAMFAASSADVAGPGVDPFGPLAADLRPATRWFRRDDVRLGRVGGDDTTPAAILARPGLLDRVDVVAGAGSTGLWITDRAARNSGLDVGDLATIDGIELPVAGIYRDRAGSNVDDGAWCAHADMLLPRRRELDLPPPVLLVDHVTLASLMDELGIERITGGWESWLGEDVTVADVDGLIDDLSCRGPSPEALGWCAGATTPAVDQIVVGERDGEPEPVEAQDPADVLEGRFQSHLPFVARRSRAIQSSVGWSTWPVATFAALAGTGLVAAAASLWFERRRREVRLLLVRGVSPVGIGAKAVLELAVPLLVGTLVGIGSAGALVVALGPASAIEPSAVGRAALAGAGALALAAVTVAGVVTVRSRSGPATGRRRIPLGAFPWELPLAVATVVSYRRLGEWGVPVGRGAEVTRVDVWGLLFPMLFLVTVVVVGSRLLAIGIRVLRPLSHSWPAALYLSIRRVSRDRAAAIGLVAASAIAAGVLGYAATVERSLDATLEAKTLMYVGSDTAVHLAYRSPSPAGLAQPSTEVGIYRDAWVDIDGERQGVRMKAIDPDTFGRVAFWDPSFSAVPFDEILARLSTSSADGHVPAVLVGAEVDVAGATDAGFVNGRDIDMTVDVIDGVDAFPGMSRTGPVLFVAAPVLAGVDGLDAVDVRPDFREVWMRGDHGAALDQLSRAGANFIEDRSAPDVADRAAFQTVSWTFGFMRALGVAAGILALGGVAVYLDARRRSRVVGYALARRMGLTRGQHLAALAVELTATVVVGCVLGLAGGLTGARLAMSRIDPVPSFQPAPLLRPALVVIASLAVASAMVAGVAAALAQRRADRDDPIEVLRAGS